MVNHGHTRTCIVFYFIVLVLTIAGCKEKEQKVLEFTQIDSVEASSRARKIEQSVTTQLDSGLTISLWASDSLVADPVSIFVDNDGALYYTRTNRQKHSEFEIRSHHTWETASIGFKHVDDRSAFLKTTLSPENSKNNEWFEDLNKDGSRDWHDLTVEKEEIYKLTDSNNDGIADRSTLVLRDFNTEVTDVAGAILKMDNNLFIGVSPDMWKFTDADGDGFYEEKKSIAHGFGVHIGFGGHGMSGLEMGPDGRLYWQIGDLGFAGKDQEGNLLNYANTGVIVRCNPDGSDFEVFAYGNRNTHDFEFDDYGNLITEDNDGDHPGEMERLVYVVEGADIGWRINWQFGKYRDPANNTYKVWMDEKMYLPRFEGQAAYFLPPLANYVSGPTGFLYNPGTALSPEWKNTFFVGEFVGNPVQSGIHAFKLRNKGASFEMYDQKNIMRGVLATGVDFGPDGAIYVADWIQGWGTKNFGRVWRMDVKNPDMKLRAETQRLLQEDFSKSSLASLQKNLSHDDKRVRQKAQFELVKRGDDKVFQAVLSSKDRLARIHSIWGLAQLARQRSDYAKPLMSLLTDPDAEIRAQASRWLGDVRYTPAAPALIPLLADSNDRVKFFAAEALGRLKHGPAFANIVEMLRMNNDRDVYLRHAGSLALARINDAKKLAALSTDGSLAVRIAAVIALRRMHDPAIAQFMGEKNEYVLTELSRAINDDEGIPAALPALAKLIETTTFSNEALIRRIINANLEVGDDYSLKSLLAYAKKESVPIAMRLEAISTISTWNKPSVLDRVDGQYRGELKHDSASARNIALQTLVTLLSDKKREIRKEAAIAIGRLKIQNADEALIAKLKTDGDAEVRLQSLMAVSAVNSPQLDQAVKTAIKDKDVAVRAAALSLLGKTNVSSKEKVAMLRDIINNKTIEESRAALAALSSGPTEEITPVLNDLMTRAEQSKLPLEISIEFEESVKRSQVKSLLDRYQKLKDNAGDTLFFSYRGAISGGDPAAGRRIFFNNQNAQCLRCHAFDDMGANAGPRLNGVASRITKQQILEALLTPGKRIAPGFGTIRLELNNGAKISGTIKSETSSAFTIAGQKSDTTILKTDVVKSTLGGSSMPPMYLLLTKKEIRDVVSFLATLKE